MIKAAQEKEELQRYGDKLDQDIKKGEAENEALINTVRLVKAKNKKMNEALSPANAENSTESQELDKKLKSAQEKLKIRKNQFNELQRQLNELNSAIGLSHENETNVNIKLSEVKKDLENLDKQIIDQKAKFTRVEKALARFDRNKFSDHQNLDLDLKEAKSLIAGAGRQLNLILKPYDEIMNIAGSMMMQVGIEPELVFTRSSTNFSKTSSVNSLSSSQRQSPRSPARGSGSNKSTPTNNTPRTPPKAQPINLSMEGGRPPSVASSRQSFGSLTGQKIKSGGSTARKVTSPLASSRSSRSTASNKSDLSLSGSKIGKR